MGRKSSSTERTTQSVLEYAERGTLCLGIFTGGLALFQSSVLQLAVPALSLSLVLGYFNRKQMDQTLLEHVVTLKLALQKLEKVTSRPIPQPRLNLGVIEQQISDLHSQDGALHQAIADVNQQLQDIPTQATLDGLYQSIAQLTQIVKELQHQDLKIDTGVDRNVDVELAKVQAAHQALGAQLQMQLEEMHHEISVLRTQPIPSSLIDLVVPTPETGIINPLLASPVPLVSAEPTLADGSAETLDLVPLTTQLQWVSGQVDSCQLQLQQLIQQFQQMEIAIPLWEQLTEDLQNLTHRVDAWEMNSDQRWGSIKQGLKQMPQLLQAQLNEQLQAMSQTSVKPEEFYVLQRHIQQQTDALRAKLEQAVSRFSQDIDTLSSQVQGLIPPDVPPAVPSAAPAMVNGRGSLSGDRPLPSAFDPLQPSPSFSPLQNLMAQSTISGVKMPASTSCSPVSTSAHRQCSDENPDWDSLLAELDEGTL